jgi:hypothetical protein
MNPQEQIRYLQQQLNDIDKQLRALQRLDAPPPFSSIVTYSGTPTAGQLAQWTGPGTVTESGYAGSAVARYSGVPSNGQLAYWTAAGTVTGGTAVPDAYIQTIGDVRYLPVNGTHTSGGFVLTNYREDVADITSTQALTIQVTSGAARRLHITHFDVALARGATNNIYGYFTGWVAWTWETGGATTIRASDVSHGTSGTDACTLTTITNGIQVVVDSSAFGNTLDSNALFVHDVSETAITVATSIA